MKKLLLITFILIISSIYIQAIQSVSSPDGNIEFTSFYPIETEFKRLSIPVLKSGEEKILTHDFYISPTAENQAEIKFQYETSISSKILSGFFTIPIATLSRNIAFDRVTIKPDKVPPGETAEIIFTIENSAPVTLTDIDVKLNLSYPFSPIKTTNERRILSPD